MADDLVFCNLVVLGHMNPMIHHPMWYRHFDLLSMEETDEAMQSPNTYAVPPISQIEIGAFKIVCQQDRWEIQTTEPKNLGRIRRITEQVFDDLLPHTPVSRVGVNFHYDRPTGVPDVGRYLASRLAGASLGIAPGDTTAAEITLRRTYRGHTSLVSIKPSSTGSNVAVVVNFDYPLVGPEQKELKVIKFADMFRGAIERNKIEAEREVDSIVQAADASLKG